MKIYSLIYWVLLILLETDESGAISFPSKVSTHEVMGANSQNEAANKERIIDKTDINKLKNFGFFLPFSLLLLLKKISPPRVK